MPRSRRALRLQRANEGFAALLLLAGFSLIANPAAAQDGPHALPSVIHLCAVHCATWVRADGQFRIISPDGATSTSSPAFSVEALGPHAVTFYREDPPGGQSPGLVAVYTGTLAPDGHSVFGGTVRFTWPGHAGFPSAARWSATWNELQPLDDTEHMQNLFKAKLTRLLLRNIESPPAPAPAPRPVLAAVHNAPAPPPRPAPSAQPPGNSLLPLIGLVGVAALLFALSGDAPADGAPSGLDQGQLLNMARCGEPNLVVCH